MIIELSNGLDHLFQWDTGQKVTVPENVPTVHFKWGNDAVSFDVVDGWVEIPPELTQKAGYILLWTYREDHTLDAARIPVERRPKPDGYAYTPTEVKTWEQLDERIKALESTNVQSDWDQNDPEGKGFIRNRPFYAEEPPIITNLGNTYDVWDKICTQNGAFSNRDDVEKAALSFIIEGTLYKNIVPRFFFSAYVYNYVAGEYEVTVYENNSQIKCFVAGKEVTNWQIVSVSDKEKVHHLDSKYLDPGLLARIEKLESGGGVAGVSSVNGQTGDVTITASGIGAATPSDVNTAVNSAWSEAQQTLGPLFDAKQPKGDYITQDGLQDATNAALAQAKASGEFDGAGLDVTGATVGQIVKISAVDANGVPTAWEPVDMASGGDGERWEKIADVALTADVSTYQLANFGQYRKVKVLISRSSYVSGLNKNVWFRVRSATDEIAVTYIAVEYGYIASEINAEMGDMFTHVGGLSTNNRQSAQSPKRTIDVVSPTNPSAYGLYMVFVDTSVIQSGDTVTVYGVRR